MKQYIGLVRDKSISMRGHAKKALEDYNSNIDIIKRNAATFDIDTIVSVVDCGGPGVKDAVINSSVNSLKVLTTYDTPGGSTPLYDSIGRVIDILKSVPDKDDKNVSFLVMVITDGEENASIKWNNYSLGGAIQGLQNSDRWTFTFRVPRGYGQNIVNNLNIPIGNVVEWEQTEKGWREATTVNQDSVAAYYHTRSTGQTATRNFFTNIDTGKMKTDIKKLQDFSDEIKSYTVTIRDAIKKSAKGVACIDILPFVEKKTKKPYVQGTAFYQLLKKEEVQVGKRILIRNKNGKVFGGTQARDVLGLPKKESIKLFPGYHGDYDIFVQSTSVNRLLPVGTELLYWPTSV
jgi:hypothetical protein